MISMRRIAATFTIVSALTVLAACGGAPVAEEETLETSGQQLYAQNCQSCHGLAANGAGRVSTAPSHGPAGHTWHHPDNQLVDTVLGRFTYPGRTMPSFADRLSESQVRSILEYIKQGWTEEQQQRQAEITQAYAEAGG